MNIKETINSLIIKPLVSIKEGSPLFFASLYLILIPVFSLSYTLFIPSEFQHSNITLEENFKRDLGVERENIEILLASYLRELIKFKLNMKDKGVGLLAKARDQAIKVDHLEYINGVFYFRVYEKHSSLAQKKNLNQTSNNVDSLTCKAIPYVPLHSYEAVFTANGFDDYFELMREGYKVNCIGGTYLDKLEIYDTKSDFGMLSNAVPDSSAPFTKVDPYNLNFNKFESPLKTKAIHALKRYEKIATGIQQESSWSVFSRMTYFSAVTITTLGYGDITPISDTARWLVTLESILGIVIIGLFLNSVAKNIRNKTLD